MIEHFLRVIDNHFKTKGFCTGANHIQRLRMNVRSNEEAIGIFQFADAFSHRHCFSGCGSFVQQRRRSHIQPGQIQRYLLEVEQGFEAALGDFRLIRGIRGIPARIFQHVAQNNRRQLHGGVTHADVRREAFIATGNSLEFRQRGVFSRRCANLRRGRKLNIFRHNLADQRV